MFFTDCFDIGKVHDKTMSEVAQILTEAKTNGNYSLQNIQLPTENKTKLS